VFSLPIFASAQLLKGNVQDENGNGIAYATVYIKNVKLGIPANEDGDFEVKLPQGSYSIIIQSLGYEVATVEIALPRKDPLLITLAEKAYQLRSIALSAKGEDPAIAIMRRSIAMAPYYRSVVKEYTADVYLKAKIQIGNIKGIAGLLINKKDKAKFSNSTIIQESINEIKFKAPDQYEQRVKSIINASTFNLKDLGIDEDDFNVGMTRLDIYGTNPSFPLSTNAFSNYVFTYQGDMVIDNRIINKIKVTPRRKAQELLSGYLYIVDKTWSVYSLDLTQNMSFGTIRMQQNYGDVGHDIFLPISYNAEFNLSAMGVKGSGGMTGSVKYQEVVPNKKLSATPVVVKTDTTVRVKPNPKKEKLQKEVGELVSKEDLSMRDMQKAARLQKKLSDMVREEDREERGEKKSLEILDNYKFITDSNARRNDTSYWNAIRPIPLIVDEIATYKKNDSIIAIATGRDSTAKKKNAWTIIYDALMGSTYRIDSSLSLTFDGLLNTGDFNTVDGFTYELSGRLSKRFKNNQRLAASASGIWAFSRERFLWDVSLRFTYAPNLRAYWEIKGGQLTNDFAGNDGIGKVNAWSSLLFRVNYSTFYHDNFIRLNHRIDIMNGLEIATGFQWSERKELENNSDYSFFYKNHREYRPNIPRNTNVAANPELLENNKAALLNVTIYYTPEYYYRMWRGRKIMIHSDYPTFSATWNKGIPDVFQSSSNFDFLKANIRHKIRFGYFNSFSYFVEGGKFFNTKKMSFADFRHFYVNDAGLSMDHDLSQGFQLLNGYVHSTNEWYALAKVEYKSIYLLLKRLPFLSNALFTEDLYASYLLQPQTRHYFEAGYGISLTKAFGMGIFAGFDNGQYYGWGVRGFFNFDF
jgi:hypothetical protein